MKFLVKAFFRESAVLIIWLSPDNCDYKNTSALRRPPGPAARGAQAAPAARRVSVCGIAAGKTGNGTMPVMTTVTGTVSAVITTAGDLTEVLRARAGLGQVP